MLKRKYYFVVLALFVPILFLMTWMEKTGDELEEKILRLHVLANSDVEEDQELKLLVRDRILIEAESILEGIQSRDTAQQILKEKSQKLAEAGQETVREAGYGYPVKVSVEKSWFPTKEYADFALPAGEYTALRVVIGEGNGRNWWCVLFPPLCLGGASEKVEITAAMAGLSREEISLITGEDGSYVIKFKLLELWGELKQKLK